MADGIAAEKHLPRGVGVMHHQHGRDISEDTARRSLTTRRTHRQFDERSRGKTCGELREGGSEFEDSQ